MKCERGGDSHYSICKIKQSWKWHLRLEDRAVKVWYREQEGEWWLKFSVWGSRAPLWGLASIPHGWWMQESCLPARFGSCRGNCCFWRQSSQSSHWFRGLWQTERRWHGAQLCFHWLKAEQVKWSSVRLSSVEHNALLSKREQSDVFPPFT